MAAAALSEGRRAALGRLGHDGHAIDGADLAETVETGAHRTGQVAAQPRQRRVGRRGSEGKDGDDRRGGRDGARPQQRPSDGGGEGEQDGDRGVAPARAHSARGLRKFNVACGSAASAATNSCVVAKRSAGALASAVMSARSTPAGTVSRRVRTDGTGRLSRLAMIAWAFGPGVGRFSGEHLVQHTAEGVEVAPAIEAPLSHGLLGAHVMRGAEPQAGLGQVLGVELPDGAGNAEIRDSRMATGKEDVLRLDVPVHHAVRVGVRQGIGHVPCDPDGLRDRQLALPIHASAQRSALGERHGVPEVFGGLAGVEHREDMGVLELCGEVDLALKALAADGYGEFGQEHLECHLPAMPQVLREVDGGHATAPEDTLAAIAPGEFLFQRERGPSWPPARRVSAARLVRAAGGSRKAGFRLPSRRLPSVDPPLERWPARLPSAHRQRQQHRALDFACRSSHGRGLALGWFRTPPCRQTGPLGSQVCPTGGTFGVVVPMDTAPP